LQPWGYMRIAWQTKYIVPSLYILQRLILTFLMSKETCTTCTMPRQCVSIDEFTRFMKDVKSGKAWASGSLCYFSALETLICPAPVIQSFTPRSQHSSFHTALSCSFRHRLLLQGAPKKVAPTIFY